MILANQMYKGVLRLHRYPYSAAFVLQLSTKYAEGLDMM